MSNQNQYNQMVRNKHNKVLKANNLSYQEHMNQLDTIFADIQQKIETLDKSKEFNTCFPNFLTINVHPEYSSWNFQIPEITFGKS